MFLAARARVRRFTPAVLERALYDDRTLLRMLGMRRTMFVVDRELGAVMDAACTQALVPGERRRLIGLIEDQDIARDGARWLRRVSDRTVAAIEDRGTATATELTKVVPELRKKLVMGEGKTWGGTVGMSTRVLFLLATEGRIVRGAAAWPVAVEPVRMDVAAHLGRSTPDALARGRARRPPHALAPHVRTGDAPRPHVVERLDPGPGPRRARPPSTRWRSSSTTGPATSCPTTSRRCARRAGGSRCCPVSTPRSWAGRNATGTSARTQAASSTATGTPDPPCGPTVASSAGGRNAPTASSTPSLLEPVDATASRAIELEAAALTEWLAGTVVTARFRTPLEREIAAR